MTAAVVTIVLAICLAVLVGWALPAWAISRLLPGLEASGHLITNYRGRRIPTGLGLVWLVWGAGVALVGSLAWLVMVWLSSGVTSGEVTWATELADSSLSAAAIFAVFPVALVIGAACFGLVDDLFGDSSARGFRGHLSAMAHGRLTTGGLKLLGIGALALASGAFVSRQTQSQMAPGGWTGLLAGLAVWLLASLAIALTANFVNLTDLRPGRALKTYCVLAAIGLAITLVDQMVSMRLFAGPIDVPYLATQMVQLGGSKLALIALVFGPVLAAWKFDLGERAMLGDAGANAMGALAGYLLVAYSPLWLDVVVVVIMLALNLASEKVSFSAVIERVGFLRWFDGLGRLPVEPTDMAVQEGDDDAWAGGPEASRR